VNRPAIFTSAEAKAEAGYRVWLRHSMHMLQLQTTRVARTPNCIVASAARSWRRAIPSNQRRVRPVHLNS